MSDVKDQCGGSESGIRDTVPFDPWIRAGIGKNLRSGSRIRFRDEHPGSYFRGLRNNFLC
jgi:hypothetical protein